MLSKCWTGQQEVHHNAGWSIPSPGTLYAHIQESNALVKAAELGLGSGRGGRCLVVLHVFGERASGVAGP